MPAQHVEHLAAAQPDRLSENRLTLNAPSGGAPAAHFIPTFDNTGPHRPGGGNPARLLGAFSPSPRILNQRKSKANALCGLAVAAYSFLFRLSHGEQYRSASFRYHSVKGKARTRVQVSNTAFRAFSCEDFGNGRSFLRADYAIECDTEAYTRVEQLAWLGILLYPVGISVLCEWQPLELLCLPSSDKRSTHLCVRIGLRSPCVRCQTLYSSSRLAAQS